MQQQEHQQKKSADDAARERQHRGRDRNMPPENTNSNTREPSPRVLLKVLAPLGKTLAVVPLDTK